MRFHVFRQAALIVWFTAASGMLKAQTSYSYTSIDFPGALGTQVFGIDSRGDVVGQYSQFTAGGTVVYRGFVRLDDGTYKTVDDPANQVQGSANGISDTGVIAGTYSRAGFRSFVFSRGQFQTFAIANYETLLTGISTDNQLVGTLTPELIGFYRSASGQLRTLPTVGGDNIQPAAVNQQGVIVGSYFTNVGTNRSGFVQALGGTVQTVNYPGSVSTWLCGINDSGSIVGYANSADGKTTGFVMRDESFEAVTVPESTETRASGINAGGVIAGTYFDQSGAVHGFIAVPRT